MYICLRTQTNFLIPIEMPQHPKTPNMLTQNLFCNKITILKALVLHQERCLPNLGLDRRTSNALEKADSKKEKESNN